MTIVNADQIGATIVAEFVGAGESARKAGRPELMRMIQYVTEHQVNYCIVHKVDRLARNRADDVTIHLALRDVGVMLVSASENIDETPSGTPRPQERLHPSGHADRGRRAPDRRAVRDDPSRWRDPDRAWPGCCTRSSTGSWHRRPRNWLD